MNLSESKGTQLHIRGVLLGATRASCDVTTLKPESRAVVTIKPVADIGLGSALDVGKVQLGATGSRPLHALERGWGRFQRTVGLPLFFFWDNLRLYDACRRMLGSYDLLHAHFDLMPLASALAGRSLGVPLVLDCEGDWFDELQQRQRRLHPLQEKWARWCQGLCFGAAQAIICVSEELRHHLCETWRLPASKLHVLPNCVDVDLFSEVQPKRVQAWRQDLGISSEPIVMFVGGFDARHALDQLIESFSRVCEKVPSCRLVMVGEGRIRGDLEAAAARLGIARSITWLGAVSHRSIPDLLGLADVVVSPAREFPSESVPVALRTSPLKLLEYMAAGRACVATATGQQSDLIKHRETGLLVPPGDVEGFADAVIRLVSDPEECARLGTNARKFAVEHHSWQEYGGRLKSIYQNVLSERDGMLWRHG